ncbi:DnaJ domain-containing protein [Candidatus Woesearchaeota archaeon]|nr:DnaJ domain-containing protein [Candidatus Woesearchaeota archaeon]
MLDYANIPDDIASRVPAAALGLQAGSTHAEIKRHYARLLNIPPAATLEHVFLAHYRAFNLTQDASADDVSRAYRKASTTCHPDTHPGDAKAAATFQLLTVMRDVLMNPGMQQKFREAQKNADDEKARCAALGVLKGMFS